MFTGSLSARNASREPVAANDTIGAADIPSVWGRRTVLLLPVGIFAGMAVLLGSGLRRDPRVLPSALVGKSVPHFSLPPVQGRSLGLSTPDLKGEVSLVNVFASWCVACREEHPVFMELKRTGLVPVHGINYKDRAQDAADWLDTLGDPYTRTGADPGGRVSIDWGVYGVPETFVINRDGQIAFKQVGPITPEVFGRKIAPLIQALQR